MLRRLGQLVLTGGVLAMGVSALACSVAGHPEVGLAVDAAGAYVQDVIPGSPAWIDGIRKGDRIIELHDALDPGGWSISTTDGSVPRTSSADGDLSRLRHSIPLSALALLASLLAGLLAYRGLSIAAVTIPLAIALAGQPLLQQGNMALGILSGLAVFGGATLALVAFGPWRRWFVFIVAASVVLGTAWIVVCTAVPAGYGAIDQVRSPSALVLSVLGLVTMPDRQRLLEFMTGKGGPAFVDIAYLSAAGALVLAAGYLGQLPVEFLVIGALVAVVVYPFWRRKAVTAFDRFVTSRARREAAIRAVEDERGRLAREIHDAPLQELSGVIRRLEAVPGAESEAIALRSVAQGLRDVATDLHPPVLQDLGLAAAIADLGDHLSESHPGWRIVVDVDDVTVATRPPADVELAAFRVIQEATTNAFAHSGGRCLEIGGLVTTDAINLRTTDDGHGFDTDDARDARRAGHFGLDAMCERAAAVDASVVVSPGPTGSSVLFAWERR